MMTATHTIPDALRAIAAACDGADSLDGVGFNGQDTVFGRALAAVPPDQWTPGQEAEAHRLLRKYKGQLSGYGIDYDALPVPPADVVGCREVRLVDTDGSRMVLRFTYDPAVMDRLRRAVRGAKWDGASRVWVAPLTRKADVLAFAAEYGFAVTPEARTVTPPEEDAPVRGGGKVDVTTDTDGLRFALVFDYDPDLVAQIRLLPGRSWDRDRKVWTLPLDQVRTVRAFAAAHGFALTPAADACPDVEPDDRPALTVDNGEFVFRFGYDRDLVALVKSLPGARWSPAFHAWQVPLGAAVEVHQFITKVPTRYGADVEAALAHVERELESIAASMATDADLTVEGLARDLMPFQRAGVAYALDKRRTFIADDQGLGKTIQAIAALEATGSYPAVVVTPAVAKINWRREIAMTTPHRTVEVLSGRTATALPPADVYVINYDVLASWAPRLKGMRALVLDESHYVMSPKAERSIAALAVANSLAEGAVRLCLTGTASSGDPAQMVHQLRILGRLEDFGGSAEYRKAAKDRRNLPALNRKLRATCFVRRLKGDVLKDLPPRRWVPVHVEGDAVVMRTYREAEANLLAFLATKAREAVLASGATTAEAEEAAWRAAARAQAAEHLVRITHLRQLVGQAKMPALREWLGNMDAKVIAFGWHTPVVDALNTEFAHGCRISGGMTATARQAAVDRFQNDETQKVIACQMKAAGIAITLTAASDVAFAEYGWTPADMDQAVDRAHRIGQTDSVTGWLFHVEGTIDDMMAEIIAEKRLTTRALLDGEIGAEEDATGGVLGDLVERLTARALEVGA